MMEKKNHGLSPMNFLVIYKMVFELKKKIIISIFKQ